MADLERQRDATQTIERLILRKQSKRQLQEEIHWKIFSDLDTIEEKEMLQLASFLKIVLDKVPNRSLSNYTCSVDKTVPRSVIDNASPSEILRTDLCFEVFENERRSMLPPHNFGPGNLFIHPHFSDFTGKVKIDCDDRLENVPPPPGHEWVGDWHVCRSHTQTDAQGWSYAIAYDFLVSNCRNNKSIARSNARASRRRRHIRYYRKIDSAKSDRSSGSSAGQRKSLYPNFSDITSLDILEPSATFNISPERVIDLAVTVEVVDIIKAGRRVSQDFVLRLLEECSDLFRGEPNMRRVEVAAGGRMVVVGDIHGSLSDLIHILDNFGMPSNENKYLFNGDFVDRGESGVEVMIVLLALYRAAPSLVILNRGNHEDGAINAVYGFQEECTRKFDNDVYEKFCVLFSCLPVFVLVNSDVFVVHGGLFIDVSVSFEDLERIDRFEYECSAEVPYPECLEGLDPEEQWASFNKELLRNALWSDPKLEPGLQVSKRGSGVLFGPDVAAEFMRNNHVKMVIRSHEVCKRGFYLPYARSTNPALSNPESPLLCTVFSASNYGGCGNEAAVIVLTDTSVPSSYPIESSSLYYSIHRFQTSTVPASLEASNKSSLTELILKRKRALRSSFEECDKEGTGMVSRSQWADIMLRVTMINILWLGIIDSIVPDVCLTPSSVNYCQFLDLYSVHQSSLPGASGAASAGAGATSSTKIDLDSLYGQRKRLEVVFNFFDANGDGVISKEEFFAGCTLLNSHLPEGQQLSDVEHILQLLDFDGSGNVDLNEFFEAFRILEGKGIQLMGPT